MVQADNNPSGKRITVTLPQGYYDDLETLSDLDGDKVASRAAFYIQQAIAEARAKGTLDSNSDFLNLSKLIDLLRLMLGLTSTAEIVYAEIAQIVGVSAEQIDQLMQAIEAKEVLRGALKSLAEARDFDGYSVAELSDLTGCAIEDLDRLQDQLLGLKTQESNQSARIEHD